MIHFSASEMRNKGRTGVSHFKKRYALRQDVGYVEKKSSLCVMSLNVNGLTQSSVHDIEAAVNERKVDIVAVTETKFRLEENPVHHHISGYKSFETRRSDVAEDRGGGGIIVYYREGLNVKQHSPPINNPLSSFVNSLCSLWKF